MVMFLSMAVQLGEAEPGPGESTIRAIILCGEVDLNADVVTGAFLPFLFRALLLLLLAAFAKVLAGR